MKTQTIIPASCRLDRYAGALALIDILYDMAVINKANGIHTAVDTAGHIPFQSFEKILPYTDLFLYDIKILDIQKHKKYIGVGNELILENLKKLFKSKAKIWIRIPIISDINDSVEEMQKIKDFLDENGKPAKIELLPYHAMGENKYASIGKETQRFAPPDNDMLNKLKAVF